MEHCKIGGWGLGVGMMVGVGGCLSLMVHGVVGAISSMPQQLGGWGHRLEWGGWFWVQPPPTACHHCRCRCGPPSLYAVGGHHHYKVEIQQCPWGHHHYMPPLPTTTSGWVGALGGAPPPSVSPPLWPTEGWGWRPPSLWVPPLYATIDILVLNLNLF